MAVMTGNEPTGTRVRHASGIPGTVVRSVDLETGEWPPISKIRISMFPLFILIDAELWPDGSWNSAHNPYYCADSWDEWEITVGEWGITGGGEYCPACGSARTGWVMAARRCEDCWHTWL